MEAKDKAKGLLRSVTAEVIHRTGLTSVLKKQEDVSWRVLMYHRVISPEMSPYPLQPGMYVTPKTFAMQMEFLADKANVITLDELAESLAQKKELPARSLALSFDDGWADIYQHAYPILKDLALPATFFLPTSYIGTNEWFWADKAAVAITALRKEKQYLQTVCARIEECKDISGEKGSRINALLTLEDDERLTAALDSYIEELKLVEHKKRYCIVNTLVKLAKEFTNLKFDRAFLNWEEVEEMAADGFRFGSHSHLHENFAKLSQGQLSDEIENSYQLLRGKNLDPSAVFCYPGGKFNEASQRGLAEKKLRFALTTSKSSVLDDTPMQLGRVGIHEDISNTPALFSSRIWVSNIF